MIILILKMKEFVIQWRKFELKRSYINEFMNFLIFQNFWILFWFFRIYLIVQDPRRWRGAMRTHGGATQAHMDAYVVPMWREQWYRTVRIKSRNQTVMIKSRNQTVGIKSRDWTAEIKRSVIRVMGHDPTDYVRSDGWNYTEWNPHHEPWSHRFCAVRWLKLHGVKSASWATIHQFLTNFSINKCSLPL